MPLCCKVKCPKCYEFPRTKESTLEIQTNDWCQPYIDYLREGSLPSSKSDTARIKKYAPRYYLNENKLYRWGFNSQPLRCLADQEQQKVLKISHNVEHQGGARMFAHLLYLGYYWSTMEKDSIDYAKRCISCQLYGNLIHALAIVLQTLSTPW